MTFKREILVVPFVDQYPLADQMFRQRTTVFRDRKKWDVTVLDNGWERDEYDDQPNVLYFLIVEDGVVLGSARLMPFNSPCMIVHHFRDLINYSMIVHPLDCYWEVTRFCVNPDLTRKLNYQQRIARELLIFGYEFAEGRGLKGLVAVAERPMVRVYRQLGWESRVMGTSADKKTVAVMMDVEQRHYDRMTHLR